MSLYFRMFVSHAVGLLPVTAYLDLPAVEKLSEIPMQTAWSSFLCADVASYDDYSKTTVLKQMKWIRFHINYTCVKQEIKYFQAVVRWLEAPRHPCHLNEPTLTDILPHIRFAMMSADQLCELEKQPIVERYSTLFVPYINRAYKYLSLTLAARTAIREFHGPGFLLRNYTETRWDKRLVLANYSSYQRCSEVWTWLILWNLV